MKTVCQKKSVRITATILFFVFLVLGIISATAFRYGLNDNWYNTQTKDFTGTYSCQSYVDDALSYIGSYINWSYDVSNKSLGSYAGEAFSYIVKDANGNITADTTTQKSTYVTRTSLFVSDYNGDGLYEGDGTVEGYVNLPVEPYEGCYTEYYIFSVLFSARYLIALAVAVFFLLEALTLIIMMQGAYGAGKNGKLSRLACLPFDIQLAGNVVLFVLLCTIANRVFQQIFYYILGYRIVFSWEDFITYTAQRCISSACWISGIVIAAVFLMGHLGQGHINTLTAKIAQKVSFVWWVIAAVLIHLLLLWFAVVSWNRFVLAALFFVDIAALSALIIMAREADRINQAAHELAHGNLNFKTDTKKLHLIWRTLGLSLNSIGDGMTQAVEDRIRSERMKTELITNVSHDLKTPLTSMINYVGLLKNTTDETQRGEYLAVLERQSAKLKKLTEDVVVASKAASGTVTVNAEIINAGELLEQSVGEYQEQMRSAGIEPMVHITEGNALLFADGSLLGRVLENLITNIEKYTQPGTRAYFDLRAEDGNVIITVRNISRDPLHISAEELMERFVRGDSSRNSEGSGLGLSIAKSLTELMGGHLDLILDGDLFKAIITFSAVTEEETEQPAVVV